jgi:hypothetical protein
VNELERIRALWLQTAPQLVDRDGISRIVTCPGVRDDTIGLHCLIYADEATLWPDVVMSGENVYQMPIVNAIRALVAAARPLVAKHPDKLAYMPNELVAIAQTDSLTLEAAGVRMYGPCSVPTANLTTVWKAAGDDWVNQASVAEFEQLLAALDPWSRVLIGMDFFLPARHKHWLNFMVVPEKPLSTISDHELVATVTGSQPGWNFVRGDKPESFVGSIREILSILEEHGF